MGRAVYFDGEENGIKVSVRAEPGAKVQIILLSDDAAREKPGMLSSAMREWDAHEALRAAALLVEAEEAFRCRPKISWAKDEPVLGLRVVIEPREEASTVQIWLRSDSSEASASRDLLGYTVAELGDAVAELILALQRAVEGARSLRDSFDDDDD